MNGEIVSVGHSLAFLCPDYFERFYGYLKVNEHVITGCYKCSQALGCNMDNETTLSQLHEDVPRVIRTKRFEEYRGIWMIVA